MIASIDAGLRGCGVAIWSDEGILTRAAYVVGAVKRKGVPLLVRAMAWREMTNAVGRYWGAEPDVLAIEAMQTYGGRAKKGDANDLLQVNAVVGAISMLVPNTRVFLPSEWKGSVEKQVVVDGKKYNPIEERVRCSLSEMELRRVALPSAKSLQHNVFDALGVGLHYLGMKHLRHNVSPQAVDEPVDISVENSES